MLYIFRYLIQRVRHRTPGMIPQDESEKDYKYEDHFEVPSAEDDTPAEVIDLRSKLKVAVNQGSTQACTGFAVGAMCEYLLASEYEKGWRKISPLFNWYWGRVKHGYPTQNKGVWLRYSLDELFDKGFVYEQTMPFKSPYLREPTGFEMQLANMVKTLYFTKKRFGYYLLQAGNTEMVRDAIKNKNPIVFGMWLNNSFYGNRDGVITESVKNGSAHAMLIVGYDDEKQCYIVRNSWGRSWGDKGYCYVPYDYLHANSFDMWTIRRKAV